MISCIDKREKERKLIMRRAKYEFGDAIYEFGDAIYEFGDAIYEFGDAIYRVSTSFLEMCNFNSQHLLLKLRLLNRGKNLRSLAVRYMVSILLSVEQRHFQQLLHLRPIL